MMIKRTKSKTLNKALSSYGKKKKLKMTYKEKEDFDKPRPITRKSFSDKYW